MTPRPRFSIALLSEDRSEKFEKWSADRARLDEVQKPKTETCLRDEHNEDLARHIPLGEVIQTGTSLTWFVWCLHACPDLQDALALG